MSDKFIFSIGICDDEETWCTVIADSCSRYLENNNLKADIVSYNSGENLVADKDKEIDLLFLDVEMESMDGLTVMKEVEKLSNIHNIIFVSSHSEAVWDSFGYKTMGFIKKPFKDEDLWPKLESIYSKKLSDRVLKFPDFKKTVYYNKSDIVLVKADSNYATVHTAVSEKKVACTLKECENALGGLPFVRIHKSYIVNLEHVSNVTGKTVVMKNEEIYSIGRSYREEVKKVYQNYLRGELHK